MPPTAGALTVTEVRKRFERGGPWVLDGVELRLRPGSATVVTGANGSGKSTLLRIVAGLTRPTSGRVSGRPAEIAFAPERLPTRVRMSARVYCEHMGRLRGLDEAAAAAGRDELFARLALNPGPDVVIGTLSKGNRQKVALVQALLAPVPLLVLDEPFSGLDTAARAELVRLVDERVAEGAAALMSSHLVPDATSHDVFVLRGGRLAGATRTTKRPMSRIVLRATASATSPRDISGLTGVASLAPTPDGVELTVERAHADRVLVAALGSGWSVSTVVPLDGRDEPPRNS